MSGAATARDEGKARESMVRAARIGTNEAAFAVAFEREADLVWRALGHFGVPEAVRPDLAQEVFLVLHRRWSEVEEKAQRSFLFGTCRRLAASYRRRAHVRREQPTERPPEGVAPSPEHMVESQRRRAVLRELLAEIDEDRRVILVLYELEGWTMKEVAGTVGVPLKTAYGRLYAARKALAASWLERMGDKEGRDRR